MKRKIQILLTLTLIGVSSGFPGILMAQPQAPTSVGEGQRGFFPMKPGPEVQLQSSDLEKEAKPQPEDAEVLAVLDNEKLSRGYVRVLSLSLRKTDPSLTPDEAFHRALFTAAYELTMYTEATRRGLIVPLDQATKVRDEQKQLCQQSQECIEATTMMAAGFGMSEAEYWSAERYQRALTISQMSHQKTFIESGLTKEQQTFENIQNWQRQVLREAPIRWLDPKLEQEFPDVIANMKPVVAGGANLQGP